MSDQGERQTARGTVGGKAYLITAAHYEGERAFVELIEIEGEPPIEVPDEIADADSLDLALENGHAFVRRKIGGEGAS